ncbi:hypothetical protein ALNOE001_08310 [Candidatus Methanobinarius endosymbioticus]|uniref:Uncharacterized protein n=1 Tax=Candidatus Methanobinarius endosymbioticus TaxID=2006182 RepID=A0A366MBF8_9EURY|nr:hypothetical protein ALNOE001_08310 [Candidatus Methanobinarius endosymbioticus]
MFWGEKVGTVKYRFDHVWSITQVTEKLAFEEMEEREKLFSKKIQNFQIITINDIFNEKNILCKK